MTNNAINILAEAFEGNGSVIYATGHSANRRKALIRYSYHQALLKGKIYQEKDTVALLIYKNKSIPFLAGLPSTIDLLFNSLRFNIFKVAGKEKKIKAIHQRYKISDDAVYLWFIGTRALRQGKGEGSQLLRKIIEEHPGREIILETSVIKNIEWYRKHGFDNYYTENIDGVVLYFFIWRA